MTSPRVLKEVKCQLLEHLTLIFSKSLHSGSMSDEWKFENVTPFFEKGSYSLPCNYQPIILTLLVCKMLDTIIRDKRVNQLEKT